MIRYLSFLLIAWLLASCASTNKVTTATATTQRQNTQRLDSLFTASLSRDSIYVRDSIYIREKGDTVLQYVEKVRYAYKNRTDTVVRYAYARDTMYIERTDSVTLEKPILIEKPAKWYNTGFQWAGKLCCLALILWALFLYLKRKF